MPETKPEADSPKPEETSGVESSVDSSPKAIHGLETHALSVREQLMRQWPSGDWERRGE